MRHYLYRCPTCGYRIQRVEYLTEAPIQDCPSCQSHMQRVCVPLSIISGEPTLQRPESPFGAGGDRLTKKKTEADA